VTDAKLNTLQFVLYQYIAQANSLATLLNNQNSSMALASLAKRQTTISVRMTVTIIVVLPIIMVYPFFQRFFIKGIMIGAVKG
jgi:putative aldouronate transport system permease protein